MGKTVQISQELFLDLLRYHIADMRDAETEQRIINGITAKVDKMSAHQEYTKFKDKSLSPEEREKARQAYLDRVGINQSFRW